MYNVQYYCRYNHDTDTVTLTTDRCPYRGQNLDYSKYLVTALYFESWKTEHWETKEYLDEEQFTVEVAEGEKAEYLRTLQDILNKGEDEISLRQYKEATRKLLNLPVQEIKPQIISN